MSPILKKEDKLILKKTDFNKVPDLLQKARKGIIVVNGDNIELSDIIKKRGTGIYKKDRSGSCGVIVVDGREFEEIKKKLKGN